MERAVALLMVLVMMLGLGVKSFAAGARLTLDEAKQTALARAGVNASEASFTKAYQNWDDGREVYELEFFVNGAEYDMDVDVLTGRVTDFSVDYHVGSGGCNNTAPPSAQPGYGCSSYRYYDDWEDRYDYDDDDMYDDFD